MLTVVYETVRRAISTALYQLTNRSPPHKTSYLPPGGTEADKQNSSAHFAAFVRVSAI